MGFLYSQLVESRSLPYPETLYSGKTIVITGSNVGLGLEAARHYARLDASKLILAVRNLDKGLAAKEKILLTASKATEIEVWKLDMADYDSVKSFAARVSSDLDRVDIFHANAGLVCVDFTMTAGNETMITVNVVSTFLLVALVLPKLKETAAKFNIRPTLVITSSGAYKHTKFPHKSEPKIFDALNDKAYAIAHWNDQYPMSKLLEIFALRCIAEEHPASSYPVTINAVSPGLCHSQLSRQVSGFQRIAFSVVKAFIARSTELGSRTLVNAGVQGPESHGQYLDDCKVAMPEEVITANRDGQARLWTELKAKLEEIQPGVTNNF
ncbi:uncharacterized protein V1516DRAFT_712048 [Lipomyces oligophaga]|uniref:uncharacterized protein n=1 Tax=Lipomyces oligophaga TaxID=45792 RepID=UPI0034CE0A27